MTIEEERELIAKVILFDDHKAFATLIHLHQNGIKNLLLKLLHFDNQELDDLYQETCTKIYRNMKQFKGKSRFSTWVYRIAYNTFLNFNQHREKRSGFAQSLTTDPVKRSEIRQDMKMDMENMINALRPEEKAAIQLSYVMGFSHGDIAQIMDCPVGSVKSWIKRGKERIANQFKNYRS